MSEDDSLVSDKILMVDDEMRVVSSFRRLLSRDFRIDTATSAQEALKIIETTGPYAVVVSDLNMPGMTGIELLATVKQLCPDTVRILLTGNVEIDSAVRAINQGYVYRFLTKPCSGEELVAALHEALHQYRLGIAEREVLEHTLMGALTVLAEVLSTVHPAGFGRVAMVRRYARYMAVDIKMQDVWRIEAAVLLSQIGLISVPIHTLEKYYLGEPLGNAELSALASHPRVGHKLLESIPRLKSIADMIRRQQSPYFPLTSPIERESPEFLGAQILHAALDFDQLTTAGLTRSEALAKMRERQGEYNPLLLDSLAKLDETDSCTETESTGSAVGPFTISPEGETEIGFAPIAAQIWQVLNEQSNQTPSVANGAAGSPPDSPVSARLNPADALAELLSSFNDHFDALYRALPDWEERMLLRECYVVARDAFCAAAEKSFNYRRQAADGLAGELRDALARIDHSERGLEQLQQRLRSFVTATNLATRLATLTDAEQTSNQSGMRFGTLAI
jgi:response regulator RpfG family c-di-GMP phosphodiesterase